MARGTKGVWILLLAGLGGCSRTASPPPVDTGSREAVRVYYEGIIRQDWQSVYAILHPDLHRRYTREQFVLLAQAYRKKIGFEPGALHIRSCEEHGAEAIAHVVLKSRTASHKRRYSDGIVVRQSAGGWRIVLPNDFSR